MHGAPETLTDLPAHVLIGADRDPIFQLGLERLGGPLPRRSFRLRCDSEAAQISALRQGLGIAFCQTGIAARDPDLIQVLPKQVRFFLDCWLVTHNDLRMMRRVRLVQDHLAQVLPGLFARRPAVLTASRTPAST
jgi:DNA-binding transcriptional LysR family regulator